MDNELLISRFFTTNDKKMNTVVFPLPAHWWSRPYEYAWAAELCDSGNVVLDAACGIPHPFKFYLAEHCKAVYAIDKDERIMDDDEIERAIDETFGRNTRSACLTNIPENLELRRTDITSIHYGDGTFDKIFCISVLEHLSDEDKLKALKEFRRALKDGGMVILTLDYSKTPDYSSATMEQIEALLSKAGLRFAGGRDETLPANAISWNRSLFCFRMALVKDKDDEAKPEQENKAKKPAPTKPKSKAKSKAKGGEKIAGS